MHWADGFGTFGAKSLPRQRRIHPIAQGIALGTDHTTTFQAPTGRHPARDVIGCRPFNAADVPACGMMDRAVGPWWLLRMVSWGDAPGWDGMGPLARKNPPASKNQQSSVDNHQSNLSQKIRVISAWIPPDNPANFRIQVCAGDSG
jgi:hypothetical protein